MGFRDKVVSAITGIPAPPAPPRRRSRYNAQSRPAEPNASRGNGWQQNRDDGHPSVPQTRPRKSQLLVEDNPAPASRRGPALDGLERPATNPPPERTLSMGTTTSSAQSLTKTSRPYQNSGSHEAFTLNPSRRPMIEGPREMLNNTDAAPTKPAAENYRPPKSAAPEKDVDRLPPMSEREIVDVTNQTGMPHGKTSFQRQFEDPREALRRQQTGPFGNIPEPSLAPRPSAHRPSDAPGPTFPTQTGEPIAQRPQGLYLGVFDLETTNHPSQQAPPNHADGGGNSGRGGLNQPSPNPRGGNSFQRGSSTHASTHRSTTTVIREGYESTYPPPPRWIDGYASYHPYCNSPFAPRLGYHPGLFPDYFPYHDPYSYWTGLPWYPRPCLLLPRQTIFTEISTDYFEEESPTTPILDLATGLEVINRYYNGWRVAYARALAGGHGGDGISAADRARIEQNREKLQVRQEEARARVRRGDREVVKETLEQVKMDRQMAVDMPAGQVAWATPWIREVWVKEHGEVTG